MNKAKHSHHSHRQLREDNYGLDREKEMIKNRLVLILITLAIGYFLEASWAIFYGLLAHFAASLANSLTYHFHNKPSNLRRMAGLCTDFGAGLYLFSIGGESVAALYPIYLWVILGYGFRFGNRWLCIAAVMGTLSFAWSIFNVPFWEENLSLAAGLVIGLLVIPAYCSTLITKISVAKEEAEKANKAKTLFLASISHELRTPLNAIIGYGTHLLDMDLPEKQRQMIGTSVSAGRHLLHLINQLLSFAKSETLEELPESQEFRPIDILTEVRDILKISAMEKGLNLNLQAEAMSDQLVAGQVDYVKNILINLTSNAVKFTDNGTVSIKCGINDEANRKTLWCSVSDTGPGIAEEAQEKIFGVFQQADDSISNKFGGTGLGLSICRQLAEQLGGQVSVESQLGEGSCFTFSCPVDDIDHSPNDLSNEIVRIFSVGINQDGPAIDHGEFGATEIEHICCSNTTNFDDLFNNYDLSKYDVALIAREIADQNPEGAPLWTYFADAKLPPVLLSGDDTYNLDEIQLRAAFASVLPATPDFKQLRSVVQIGCSFTTDGLQTDEEQRPEPVAFTARKILVADDNRTNQMVLETILSNAGHEVVIAVDGEKALEELENQPFDIIFLDVNMPNIGGIECCKLWRQIEGGRNHLPIIGLTADSTPETEKKCLDAGMDLRLTKPIEAKLLLSTIEQQTASDTPPVTVTNASDPFGVIQSIDAPSEPNLSAPIDPAQLDYLLSIGDEMFVQSIIDTYLEDSQQILQDFNDAVETDNIENFRFHAHAFKSGANNIGATSLSEMCGKLEVIVETDFEKNRSDYLLQVNKEICRITDHLNARSAQESTEKLSDITQTG